MTETAQSQSKSLVLRSSHILLVEVVTATAGAWKPSSPGLRSRQVELTVRVLQVLRGEVSKPATGTAHISVEQSDYEGLLRMMPLPGAWSAAVLEPGARLVVFANAAHDELGTLLHEPACKQVMGAEPVLPGLLIASASEKQHLSLERTLSLAAAEMPQLDMTFADFLWAKYGAETMENIADFDRLEDFTERRGLQAATREVLMTGGYDLASMHEDLPRMRRVALTMCRLLLLPEAAELHENILGTDLPNLLGLTSALPAESAASVFKNHEADRNALEKYLQEHRSDEGVAPLLAWVDAK